MPIDTLFEIFIDILSSSPPKSFLPLLIFGFPWPQGKNINYPNSAENRFIVYTQKI